MANDPQTQLAQVQIEGGKTDRRKLQRHRGSPRGRTRAVHEINDGQKSVYNMQNVNCLLLRESYIYYLVEMIVGCTHKPPEEASRYHMGAQGATGSHVQTSRWRPAQWKMTKMLRRGQVEGLSGRCQGRHRIGGGDKK